MSFKLDLGPISFGSDDTAEYQYKATKDTNETSTRNLKLQLASQQQSEMRWMNFQEDQTDSLQQQFGGQFGGSGGGCHMDLLSSLSCLANPMSLLGLF